MHTATYKLQQLPRRQAGFNLVELLVALVIGVFLIGGTLSVYQESQAALLVSERMSRMQENGRYAIQVVEEDVRAVGLWGQLNSTAYVSGRATPADPIDIAVINSCVPNWAMNFDTPLEGSNNANMYPGTCMVGVGYTPNTDVLVLRHINEVDLTPADLEAGGLYLRSDQSHAQVFSGLGLPGGFSATAQLNEVDTVAYFISDDSDNAAGTPSLRRIFVSAGGGGPTVMTEEVISGVEDLQVQYGIDTNANGSANSYHNADAVPNLAAVVSLRIWLRLRSPTQEIGFVDDAVWEYADRRFRPDADGDPANDPFRRTIVSKTIELRNRRIANQAGI